MKFSSKIISTPWHNWNYAKVGVQHQSINQSVNMITKSIRWT